MNRKVVNVLAFIGALALVFLVFAILGTSSGPDYLGAAKKQFGTPAAINAMADLYTKVETSTNDGALKTVKLGGFPMVKKIPRSWLPQAFQPLWGGIEGDDSVDFGDVFAFYDEKGVLGGIEFYGSRYGCFASRDATRCPSWYQSLHRLAEKPLYITARISEGD